MPDILYEKTGHTALLTLNRPQSLNALNEAFIGQINDALDRAESDDDICTIIITGCGKAFIAGADIAEMADMTPEEIFRWSALGSGLNLRLEKMPHPVIAAINGYALGGGLELAMACDIRIASVNAHMGLPETTLGVICGAGGTQRLPAIVGVGMAKELIFTGKTIDAEEALRIGLVNRITEPDDLLDEALSIAHRIEKNGQFAVRAAKEAVNYAAGRSMEEGCLFERKTFSALFGTEDQKNRMNEFLRKKETK